MTRKLVLPQKRLKNYHLVSDYRKIKQAIVEIQQENNMALSCTTAFICPLNCTIWIFNGFKLQILYFPD